MKITYEITVDIPGLLEGKMNKELEEKFTELVEQHTDHLRVFAMYNTGRKLEVFYTKEVTYV